MFARKRLPVWALVVVLILALAGLGLGYAHWTLTLTDEGTVTTGTFVADWFNVFTDDDGTVVDSNKDAGDTGDCTIGAGSCDPSGAGPNPMRYDKGVGSCAAWIEATEDHLILHWSVSNAYPSYYCTVWGHIRNTGSVPMKIYFRELLSDPQITTGFVEGAHGFACGDQIDANGLLQVGMWIHVEQDAQPGATYTGSSTYKVVNWNEFETVDGKCIGW